MKISNVLKIRVLLILTSLLLMSCSFFFSYNSLTDEEISTTRVAEIQATSPPQQMNVVSFGDNDLKSMVVKSNTIRHPNVIPNKTHTTTTLQNAVAYIQKQAGNNFPQSYEIVCFDNKNPEFIERSGLSEDITCQTGILVYK